MKIHFLIPSTAERGKQEVLDRIFGCNYGFFPQHNIFMLYPATVLKNAGFEVEISDCVVEKIPLEKALSRGGDVFVFYSVFLSREVDLWTAKEIKKKFGPKWLIFLGSDPISFMNKYLVADNNIIIRGESTQPIVELMKELEKKKPNLRKVRGISWRRKGKIIHNQSGGYIKNLDKLPIPDRFLLKKPFAYPNARFSQFPSTTMLTSRGCSYRCLFCFPNSLSYSREFEWKKIHRVKPPVRAHSAKRVIEEFKLVAQQGFRSVSILDDQFLWERKRTEEILEGIKDLGLEISILARCDRITDFELAKMLAHAGIRHIAFGVESFHQPILDYIKKDLKVSSINQAIRWCQKAGIQPEINVMLGSCPLETKQTIAKTFKKIEKLNVAITHVNICTPFPGTDFEKMAKKYGWMAVPEFIPVDTNVTSLISYPHLTAKDLEEEARRFYRQLYFSPRYLFGALRRLKSPSDFWSKVGAAKNMIKNVLLK